MQKITLIDVDTRLIILKLLSNPSKRFMQCKIQQSSSQHHEHMEYTTKSTMSLIKIEGL